MSTSAQHQYQTLGCGNLKSQPYVSSADLTLTCQSDKQTNKQINTKESHTVSLVRHHYPAEQETGCGEQVQLHGDRYLSDQINNLHATLWPEFSTGHHRDKVRHAAPQCDQWLKQKTTRSFQSAKRHKSSMRPLTAPYIESSSAVKPGPDVLLCLQPKCR